MLARGRDVWRAVLNLPPMRHKYAKASSESVHILSMMNEPKLYPEKEQLPTFDNSPLDSFAASGENAIPSCASFVDCRRISDNGWLRSSVEEAMVAEG